MKSFFRLNWFLAVLLFLSACSSGGLKDRKQLRDLFRSEQHEEGLKLLSKSDEYKEEKTRLLLYLEQGLLHHDRGNYYQSVLAFEKAKDLSRKLYTKSISKKAKTWVANDQSDNYYGASFERSLMYFYLALNHFLLYQKGEYEGYTVTDKDGKNPKTIKPKKLTKDERRRELMGARAEILAWDSFLSTLRNEKMGNSVFKNDLMAKTFGALIHEAIGSRNDDQIALQLYKDAKKLLFRNYNGYQSFNKNFVKFKKNFTKLPSMKLGDVEKKYVSRTAYHKQLLNFLNYKILELTRSIRPREYKKMVKLHKPTKKVLNALAKQKKRSNLTIVFQRGLIPEKVPEVFYFSLESAFSGKKSKSVARFGSAALSAFAAQHLGLLPPAGNWSPGGAAIGVGVASLAVGTACFSFELPRVKNALVQGNLILKIYDAKSKKLVGQNTMSLINPLGDISEEAVAEDSAWRYTRLGTRLALKHATAIATAFVTYKALKKKMGDYLAKSAAVLEYTAATKLIAASEKADTRYWSLLPHDLRLSNVYLPKGEYYLEATFKDQKYKLGNVIIDDPFQKKIINFRSKN